jgi:uncharacterized protein (TIGR03067 family)
MNDQPMPESMPSGDPTSRPAAGQDLGPRNTPPPASAVKRYRRLLVGLGVLAGVAVLGAYFFLTGPANDLERFQGEWKLTDARQPPTSDDEVRVAVRVTGDTWQYVTAGPGGKAYRMTLNETTDPKEIDLQLIDTTGLTGGAVLLRGIYAFEGNDRARVRVRDAYEPRPRSWDDPDATDWVLSKVRLRPTSEPK